LYPDGKSPPFFNLETSPFEEEAAHCISPPLRTAACPPPIYFPKNGGPVPSGRPTPPSESIHIEVSPLRAAEGRENFLLTRSHPVKESRIPKNINKRPSRRKPSFYPPQSRSSPTTSVVEDSPPRRSQDLLFKIGPLLESYLLYKNFFFPSAGPPPRFPPPWKKDPLTHPRKMPVLPHSRRPGPEISLLLGFLCSQKVPENRPLFLEMKRRDIHLPFPR